MEHSNKPLTLLQLREMLYENDFVGLNVLLSFKGAKCAGVIDERHDEDGICAVYAANGEWLKEKDYGKTWTAYAYSPARIDSKARKPCEYCGGDIDDRPFLGSNDLYISETGCLTSCEQNKELFQMQFCPKCGRPLTDEA